MDDWIKSFREAEAKDVLKELSFCRHPLNCGAYVQYLECWGRLMPEDGSDGFMTFSRELVISLLNYGFKVVSKQAVKREFSCGEINLGLLEFVAVKSVHEQIFMVANYRRFLLVFNKNQVTLK